MIYKDNIIHFIIPAERTVIKNIGKEGKSRLLFCQQASFSSQIQLQMKLKDLQSEKEFQITSLKNF